MTLNELLLVKPREISGSQTSKKYDYQKNWALYKIIELLKTDRNFVAFIDYHEDLVILNIQGQQEDLEFYQIKCVRKSGWTKNQITKREKGKKELLNSILGKLTSQLNTFKQYVKSLNFVSNVPTRLILQNGLDSINLSSFSLNECTEKDEICLKVSNELNISPSDISPEKIFFIKTDLNEDGSEKYVLGSLLDFLNEEYPHLISSCRPLYNLLFKEINARCNFSGQFMDITTCLNKKAISREYIINSLSQLNPPKSPKEIWSKLEHRMNTENWDLNKISKIEDRWNRYLTLSKDRNNYTLQKMRKKVAKLIKENKSEFRTLSEALENIQAQYTNNYKEVNEEVLLEYLEVLILYEYYG